jgi:NADH-quinone oxidoreductase subunit M
MGDAVDARRNELMGAHMLSLLIALPLLGAAAIFFLVKESADAADNAKKTALLTTGVTFVLSLVLLFRFNANTADFQFEEQMEWFTGAGITFHLGIDGISLFMIILTTFLMPICVLCSWQSITTRVREYMICFLILESFVIGVFCALDLMLFYIFFEGMLIPMYLIIGIWGGQNRIYAAYKFFLYTLAGSVLLLIALIYLYITFGTADIPVLMEMAPGLSLDVQKWLWIAMLASFAVKVPMWPVHTWLPDAHVQAPTAGSVILAGVLLKMGAYGYLRFSLPMLPDASVYYADLIYVLSCIAVVYTSLIALMQEDMKKLIAYSSVAHMGFVTLGIFAFNAQGIEGAIVQMISHGLVSGALFLCVGVVYDRLHSREIARYGGCAHNMPHYAAVFLVFTMASVGLPGTAGFIGEMLVLIGAFKASHWAAAFAATGLILGAAYMLWLYRRICFGALVKADVKKMPDLTLREKLIFAPLVVLTILMGVYPKPVLDVLHPSVEKLQAQVYASELGGKLPFMQTPLSEPQLQVSPLEAHGQAHQQPPLKTLMEGHDHDLNEPAAHDAIDEDDAPNYEPIEEEGSQQ